MCSYPCYLAYNCLCNPIAWQMAHEFTTAVIAASPSSPQPLLLRCLLLIACSPHAVRPPLPLSARPPPCSNHYCHAFCLPLLLRRLTTSATTSPPQLLPWCLDVVVMRCWCRHPRWHWLCLPCVVDTCWNGAAVFIPMLLLMLTTAAAIVVLVSVLLCHHCHSDHCRADAASRQVSRCRATSRWDDEPVFALFLFCWLLCCCNCCWFVTNSPSHSSRPAGCRVTSCPADASAHQFRRTRAACLNLSDAQHYSLTCWEAACIVLDRI